jgi:hypothetical protein
MGVIGAALAVVGGMFIVWPDKVAMAMAWLIG